MADVSGADVITGPISCLLIANRGEIARRIIRTAHEMGIATVAVYADGDANAPFVHEADSAVALSGVSSAETYLDMDKVLAACESAGADAVHPGYGFLSENAAFARAVIDAGMRWVGPSPEAISAMGDKLSAKRLMQQAEVPTLPARAKLVTRFWSRPPRAVVAAACAWSRRKRIWGMPLMVHAARPVRRSVTIRCFWNVG